MRTTSQKICEILGARRALGAVDVEVEGVFTDTRQPQAGAAFVALRGERFDGDLFAKAALESGANLAIVHAWEGGEIPAGKAVVEVEDTLFALQRLAHWWRSQLNIPIVCITGSNGKTSTKDFAKSVLSEKYSVHATKGNLNNHIGLPLTVLGTSRQHTAAIYEIGMNHSGELAPLCEISRPTHGIITNVGTAHIEFLGSREAIAEEKGTLARYLPDTGMLFTPANCDFAGYFRERTRAQLVPIGNGLGTVRAEQMRMEERGTRFQMVIDGYGSVEVYLPVPGKHMVMNALLAAALGWKLGISIEAIARGLSMVEITNGRLRQLRVDGITLLDDTYNANPESMAAGLETLAEMPIEGGKQRIAVLGAMGELGKFSTKAHRDLGKLAAEKKLTCIAVGKGTEEIAKGAKALHFPDVAEASAWLRETARAGDIILFKGSRTAAIENVLKSAFPTAC